MIERREPLHELMWMLIDLTAILMPLNIILAPPVHNRDSVLLKCKTQNRKWNAKNIFVDIVVDHQENGILRGSESFKSGDRIETACRHDDVIISRLFIFTRSI